MKKSTGDNFFPKAMSFSAGLDLLKRAGYDGVELWLGNRPWFQMQTTDAELRVLAGQVRDAGLEVSDVANALDWQENISARDPAKRDAAMRHIERQIEATQIFGKDAMKHCGRCGEQSVYTNIFLGDNNWPAIREAIRKVNYDGWLVAEMESRYQYAADQQVYDTAAALTRFISGTF